MHNVTFSPDGTRVLTTCRENNTAKLWDASKGHELATLTGHTNSISYAAFSEIQQRFALALELLDIFENYYGANLQTMISKARIYDKMGDEQRALSQYRTLLASRYSIPMNLRDYIQNRLAQNN